MMHELNQAHPYHTIYVISLLISCMDNSYTTAQEFRIANHNANKLYAHYWSRGNN
jgi:hypothetical protein